jgi:hypothetical protein
MHTYSYVVRLFSISGDGDCDAHDAAKHEDERPPGKVWEFSLDIADDGADEGNEPCELSQSWSVIVFFSLFGASPWSGFRGESYNCNGYGGESKGVTDDVCEIEARSSLIVAFHFGLKHQGVARGVEGMLVDAEVNGGMQVVSRGGRRGDVDASKVVSANTRPGGSKERASCMS